MEKTRYQEVKEILLAVLDLAPDQRSAFLATRCGDQHALRAEVEALLAVEESDSLPIDHPVMKPAEPGGRPERIGPYAILDTLGQGGMGVVFLAVREDDPYQRRVALKVLRLGHIDETSAKRFFTEGKILAQLNHPYLATLIEAGSTETMAPYLVMEYIQGVTISDYCRREKLDLDQRIDLFRKVCDVVAFAHRNLIVHRDLKPSNILVTEDGTPKLLDFGIAKLLTADDESPATMTATGFRAMTPGYAAPEQIQGLPITTACDIYSLGVVLFELLTGCRPYQLSGSDMLRMREDMADMVLTRPSRYLQKQTGGQGAATALETHFLSMRTDRKKLVGRLSGELDNIIMTAMRREPERRYSSAQHLADDLDRFLKGFPVHAQEETFGYIFKKFIARHRTKVLLAAAALMVGVAFLGTALYQQREIRRKHVQSERIKDLLVDLLSGSDPDRSKGRDLTVRELLENVDQRLEVELGREPEIKAFLYKTLGSSYRELGIYDKADELLQRALEINLELHDENHPEVLDSQQALGVLKTYTEDFDASEALLTRVMKALEQRDEVGSPAHIAVLSHLGELFFYKGDYPEAGRYFEEVVRLREIHPADNPLKTAKSANNLAVIYTKRAQYDKAEAMHQKVLAMHEQMGYPSSSYAKAMNNLAGLYQKMGNYDAADTYYRKAIDMFTRVKETSPEGRYMSIGNLALLCFRRGNYYESEHLFLETVAAMEQRTEIPKSILGNTLGNLAVLYRFRGEYDKAETALKRGLAYYADIYPKDSIHVASMENNLGWLYLSMGRLDEAGTLIKGAYEKRKALLPPDHPILASSINNMGLYSWKMGRFEEAETLLLDALARREKKLKPDHPIIAKTHYDLACVYADWHRDAEALELNRQSLAAREAELGADHIRLAENTRLQTQILARLGRGDEAARFRQRTLAIEAAHDLQNRPPGQN